MRTSVFLLTLLSGCVQNVGPGPDLGDCAVPPDGIYTYGQVGIGTCLASPADLKFWQDSNGRTWLGVANANHYYNFDSGSALLIDWDSVDKSAGSTNSMDTLTAHALATGNYIGGLAALPDRNLLLATERFSEDATTSANPDDLLVIDTTNVERLNLWSEGPRLTLQDDPQPIAVDETGERAFVLNLTDHSISVVDLTTTPLETLSVSSGVDIVADAFEDVDSSGSVGTIASLSVIDDNRVIDDIWEMTWIEGTTRLWVSASDGLERWHSGGADWAPTGAGVEVDSISVGLEPISNPYFFSADGFPGLYFGSGGNLYIAVAGDGTATSWSVSTSPILAEVDEGAFDAYVNAPSFIDGGEIRGLYYDARPGPGEPAVIAGAFEGTSGTPTRSETPLITAPADALSVEQPFVLYDTQTQVFRMWLSIWDGTQWNIGFTSSLDGLTWSEVTEVSGLGDPACSSSDGPCGDAAPVVVQGRGRYELWFTRGDGTTWNHASAWSWDGRAWYDASIHYTFDSEQFDAKSPPRLAAQFAENGGFRIEGDSGGLLAGTARPAITFTNAEYGFSIRVASGHEVDNEDLGIDYINGITPSSSLQLSSTRALYVHGLGEDGQTRIGLLSASTAPATVMANDLVPVSELGDLSNPSHPVVYESGPGYKMVFSATDSEGRTKMYLATSDDGLEWNPILSALAENEATWHEAVKHPRSVEFIDGGGLRLWYAGSNGSRFRIGSALWDEAAQDFIPEAGTEADWQFGTGTPGTFDDTHVYDPVVFTQGETTHLIYSAFDGEIRSLGHAVRGENGTFERVGDAVDSALLLAGIPLTFSHAGLDSPVVWIEDDGSLTVWYAGLDDDLETGAGIRRMGLARGTSDELYAHQRFPTAGDTLAFSTSRSDNETDVIELAQKIEAFSTATGGASQIRIDNERGFLYVTAKVNNYIYVIDIRDDSDQNFDDRNYLDIEALIAIESNVGSRGFRDVVVPPGSNRLYAAGQRPDALVVFDITDLEDNGEKEVYRDLSIGSLPLQPSVGNGADEGLKTGLGFNERFGGGGLALTRSGLLVVTHFLDNSVSVFDLNGAGLGLEVAHLPNIGENPFSVAISPDDAYAVIGNYVGKELDNGARSSTLAIVDLDPNSATYLEPLTWMVNR